MERIQISKVMGFLCYDDLLKVCVCTKRTIAAVTYEMVFRSVLFASGSSSSAKKSLGIIVQLCSEGKIYPPTPLRILRLVNGRKCENDHCSMKARGVNSNFGVFCCHKCIPKSKVSLKYSDAKSGILLHRRCAQDGISIWNYEFERNGDLCGPCVTSQTLNRIQFQEFQNNSGCEGLMQKLNAYFDALPWIPSEVMSLYASLQEKSLLMQQMKEKRLVEMREKKRKRADNAITLFWDVIGDVSWKRIAEGTVFIKQIIDAFQNAPSKATEKHVRRTAEDCVLKFGALLESGFMTLNFLSTEDPVDNIVRNYSNSTHLFFHTLKFVSEDAQNDFFQLIVNGAVFEACLYALLVENELSPSYTYGKPRFYQKYRIFEKYVCPLEICYIFAGALEPTRPKPTALAFDVFRVFLKKACNEIPTSRLKAKYTQGNFLFQEQETITFHIPSKAQLQFAFQHAATAYENIKRSVGGFIASSNSFLVSFKWIPKQMDLEEDFLGGMHSICEGGAAGLEPGQTFPTDFAVNIFRSMMNQSCILPKHDNDPFLPFVIPTTEQLEHVFVKAKAKYQEIKGFVESFISPEVFPDPGDKNVGSINWDDWNSCMVHGYGDLCWSLGKALDFDYPSFCQLLVNYHLKTVCKCDITRFVLPTFKQLNLAFEKAAVECEDLKTAFLEYLSQTWCDMEDSYFVEICPLLPKTINEYITAMIYCDPTNELTVDAFAFLREKLRLRQFLKLLQKHERMIRLNHEIEK